MADGIKPGDVVQLKSGGPKMTVASINAGRAICEWFDGGRREAHGFNLEVLVKVPDERRKE